ncbi:MAG TPA: 4-(cytidine 5'-diphospho)-2-C-methyl-D-erythritol kinase, partial [Thermoanaerobacterales bacterium]|nr:4-(cytidine 5'-diphospho)-2-C-methyl-D-erythritol kinase [Thermoanaerobacterales bacterium]
MESVRLKSRAKINLALSVRDKRDDGYHNILSIMEAIELADEIYIENIDDGIKIECDNEDIPIDNRNLAYIAAKKIKDITGINKGVSIKIKKNIP